MTGRTLFGGDVHADYGQLYVTSAGTAGAGMSECFAGQSNGLCGAMAPGHLFLIMRSSGDWLSSCPGARRTGGTPPSRRPPGGTPPPGGSSGRRA